MTALRKIFLFNDSENYGGSEVYTHFFGQALTSRGYEVELLVSPHAEFWNRLSLSGLTVRPVRSVEEVEALVPTDTLLVNHNGPPIDWAQRLKRRGNVVVMAHHPPTRKTPHAYYAESNLVLTVSQHVLRSCHEQGYTHTYPVPLLGVGEMTRGIQPEPILATGSYLWESRKGRDWLLSHLYPLYLRFRRPRTFERRAGITIGVVSRIAHIKQFHVLFEHIAAVLARYPQINIEIFGSGKYQLVHAVERALRPLRRRVRYWGWQWDVASIYPQLDYLLAGLPELEALGLNIIEAQFCGTPVLATRAPPFTETILDGATGFLFRDPRDDQGADFDRVLRHIVSGAPHLDPRAAHDHLKPFTFEQFALRVEAAVEYAHAHLPALRSAYTRVADQH
jgi:glycosyltransferase involved in cell wall biosynthesis